MSGCSSLERLPELSKVNCIGIEELPTAFDNLNTLEALTPDGFSKIFKLNLLIDALFGFNSTLIHLHLSDYGVFCCYRY